MALLNKDTDSFLSGLREACSSLVGQRWPLPRGQTSGHAAGEAVFEMLRPRLVDQYPDRFMTPPDFLNHYFSEEGRASVEGIRSPALGYLLDPGDQALKEWSEQTPFTEVHQWDTADLLFSPTGTADPNQPNLFLVDVKSNQIKSTSPRPQNIISARKVAKMCELILADEAEPNFDLVYISLGWEREEDNLVVRRVQVLSLFDLTPEKLYVNMAASYQIQLNPAQADSAQGVEISKREWCQRFCDHYAKALQRFVVSINTEADHYAALGVLTEQ